ncbi:phosphotransferase [Spongiactinospora sp. 9N601]|uniref:phosphotransferase n=1 Tax=Spongiactinospora sp. 9N601 TaxID=3375149 RepID=UPI0037A7C5E8
MPPTTSSGTAVRPTWDRLPAPLRDGLAARLGTIVDARTQTGGFTPGLAARLALKTGESIFVKGIPADHPLADRYRCEGATVGALPTSVPAPALRWTDDIAGWTVLAFDDIPGHHADLSPNSPDVARVVTAVAGLAHTLTPAPIMAPRAQVELAQLVHGWVVLAQDPPDDLAGWPRRHLHALAELESAWLVAAGGDTLMHGDLRPDNFLLTDQATWIIDWAQP